MGGHVTRRDAFLILEMVVLAAAAVFAAIGSYSMFFGDTANSRLATVVALVDYGTWRIDRSPDEPPIVFEQRTIDKVVVDGRLYSSKPPLLPLFMTAEYLVMNRLFGWSLHNPEDTETIVRWMSITLVGLSYVLTLVFFSKTLRLFIDDPMPRFVALFALAFCTQLWGYSTNVNNHVPAACLLTISVYFGLGLAAGKLDPAPWRFFFFGLTGGLTPAMDMPAGIFVLATGLYLVYKLPKPTLIYTTLGAAIPVGVHVAIMIALTGSPMPVQSNKDYYLYEWSYWRDPRGVDALNEPKALYFFHMIFGRFGLFSLYPVLFLGVWAALRALDRPEDPTSGLVLGGFLAFAVLTAYYAASTNNYGGEAYGFRWYIIAMPVLLMMAAPLLAAIKRRWQWGLVALLIAVSFYSAWECTTTPWAKNREWTTRIFGKTH